MRTVNNENFTALSSVFICVQLLTADVVVVVYYSFLNSAAFSYNVFDKITIHIQCSHDGQ